MVLRTHVKDAQNILPLGYTPRKIKLHLKRNWSAFSTDNVLAFSRTWCAGEASLCQPDCHTSSEVILQAHSRCVWAGHRSGTSGSGLILWSLPLWHCCPALLPGHCMLSSLFQCPPLMFPSWSIKLILWNWSQTKLHFFKFQFPLSIPFFI